MSEDFRDQGNALRVQKHQLNNTEDKLSEIDMILSGIQQEQESNDALLDESLATMEGLLAESKFTGDLEDSLLAVEAELNSGLGMSVELVSEVDNVELNDDMSDDEYTRTIEEYGIKHNLNLEEDPFKSLMTKSQQVELQKRIKDEFTLKNAQCDKYDYMIAGTCGVIGGLIDIFFVGAPGDSPLGNIADEQANKITEKFAGCLGWDKNKAQDKGSNTTASAISFLEKKFKINYDQATTQATGGAVNNLSLKNHHLKGLGHSPDLIGLFFSVMNQFTNTSSFISNGKIITISTENFELQGSNFVAKVFCGVANWFGHIMSDWAGSSGTVGQGGRGTGVPIPFYNMLQMMDFGEFGQHRQSFATITTKVFEKGYDLRHGAAMAVPVLTTEVLIRLMYTIKARFYHQRAWKDCIPKGSNPELRRMLLVGHGTLCMMDGADSYLRSGGEIVQFLLRTNLVAWTRFAHLSLKELNAWYNSGHIDTDAVDEYLDKEFNSGSLLMYRSERN